MKPNKLNSHSTWPRWTALAIALLVACGDNLIRDPSFDLWCGESLCMPWEASGNITRVGTWHRSDFGVALDDAAMLTQLSTHDPVSCIEFDVIADVTASAQVWLEMDFNDDGSSEFRQLIPESHWAKLSFEAPTPRVYDKVRLILRKLGHGHAVLAQIRATSGSDCQAPPLPATHRDNGVSCTSRAQCAAGACVQQPDALKLAAAHLACGECDVDAACSDGMRCGWLHGEHGFYPACVPLAQDSAAFCTSDDQCESQQCLDAIATAPTTCAECADDSECPADQVCGVRVDERGPARACRPRNSRELGEICSVDSECKSGICNGLACSECGAEQPCANGASCKYADNIRGTWFAVGAALCGGGAASRGAGEPCNLDADCISGSCQLPEPTCSLCDQAPCPDLNAQECVVLRRLAGACS
jgi:hypothetical protein